MSLPHLPGHHSSLYQTLFMVVRDLLNLCSPSRVSSLRLSSLLAIVDEPHSGLLLERSPISGTLIAPEPNCTQVYRSAKSRLFASPVDLCSYRASTNLDPVVNTGAEGEKLIHHFSSIPVTPTNSHRWHLVLSFLPALRSLFPAMFLASPTSVPIQPSRLNQDPKLATKRKLGFLILGLAYFGPDSFFWPIF